MVQKTKRAVVTGGAGFIGSQLVDRLMAAGNSVTVIDNLSGGREEFIAQHLSSPRFNFVALDIRRQSELLGAIKNNIDVVYHLAANADISRGVEDPTLDFEHSIIATQSLLEVMRYHRLKQLVYFSGSGVYGDRGSQYSSEETGPLMPVSMYGASKLSAEGMISAYAHLFNLRAWILRPANIIGPRATHGVIYDFVNRLRADSKALHILGDGQQSKSYLHVDDVLDATALVQTKAKQPVNVFNLASNSFITVNEIAGLIIKAMNLSDVNISHSGGTIGWPGDVAKVRMHSKRLQELGWRPAYTSRQATKATIEALLKAEEKSLINKRSYATV